MSDEMKNLLKGYQRFKQKYYEESSLYETLVTEGQKPKFLVIACSDSRVDPAMIFDAKPGELFVVRNVANLVPPCETNPHHHSTSSAIEFAVLSLGVTDIVILGHSQCGGIQALMQGANEDDSTDFIGPWIDIAKPAKQKVLEEHAECSFEEQAHFCEKESLLISLKNLKSFPWIRQRLENKTLCLHAGHFDMASGKIEFL